MDITMVPLDSIVEYEQNAKIHTDTQITHLADLIKKYGFDQPLVLGKDNVIIKGHGRYRASVKLGLKEVPAVIRDDLSDEEANLSRLVDNETVDQEIDYAALAVEMQGVMSTGEDIGGFLIPESVMDKLEDFPATQEAPATAEVGIDSIKTLHKCEACSYEW